MNLIKIFLLQFQRVFEYRARVLVYFLIALINPFIMILFWQGASNTNMSWSGASMRSYYILLVIFGGLLMTHHERDIAQIDIKEGKLTQYILKPFSYYLFKLFDETAFRVFRFQFGIVAFFIISLLFGQLISITNNSYILMTFILSAVLAYLISFTFKMIVGISAFWFVDIWGIFEIVDVILIIFAGFLMPLDLLPHWVRQIAYILPFSYMLYFPVIAIQGKLAMADFMQIIIMQLMWLGILVSIYKFMWKKGLKKFTGVGI